MTSRCPASHSGRCAISAKAAANTCCPRGAIGNHRTEALADLGERARDRGLDFEALIAAGTRFDRDRLAVIEKGRVKPAPREEMPQTAEA